MKPVESGAKVISILDLIFPAFFLLEGEGSYCWAPSPDILRLYLIGSEAYGKMQTQPYRVMCETFLRETLGLKLHFEIRLTSYNFVPVAMVDLFIVQPCNLKYELINDRHFPTLRI